MIRDENGRLSGYVYVDVDTAKRDIGGYIADAKAAVDAELKLKPRATCSSGAASTRRWSACGRR